MPSQTNTEKEKSTLKKKDHQKETDQAKIEITRKDSEADQPIEAKEEEDSKEEDQTTSCTVYSVAKIGVQGSTQEGEGVNWVNKRSLKT